MNYLFIISTASCILEFFIPSVAKFITDRINKKSKLDQSLRNDLIEIKRQMGQISMVDEFAKFAKLQRQYNKLEAELKSRINALMMSKTKLKLTLTYIMKILNAIVIVVLLYSHRQEPVVILPKEALWPLQSILSWPCAVENSISLTTWLIISRLAISSLGSSKSEFRV